jgi:hypothetical protein
LLLISTFIPVWYDNIWWIISLFLYLFRHTLCDLISKKFNELMRMCLPQMWKNPLCKCPLNPFDLWCNLILKFLVNFSSERSFY